MKILDTVKTKVSSISATGKVVIGTAMTLATTCVTALADGTDTTALDPSITAGFTSAGKTVALVIGAGVAATVGVIGLSGGAKAGLKWIKGVFSKAA